MTISEGAKFSPQAKRIYDNTGKMEMLRLFAQFGRHPKSLIDPEQYEKGDMPYDLSDIGLSADALFDAEARDENKKNRKSPPPWEKTDDSSHPYDLHYQDVSIAGRKALHSTAFLHFSFDYVNELNCNIALMSDARNRNCWRSYTADSLYHGGEDFRASLDLGRVIVFHRKTVDSPWVPCHHPRCEKLEDDGYSKSIIMLSKIARLQY